MKNEKLSAEARKARSAVSKKWKEDNPQRAKETLAKYWARKAEESKAVPLTAKQEADQAAARKAYDEAPPLTAKQEAARFAAFKEMTETAERLIEEHASMEEFKEIPRDRIRQLVWEELDKAFLENVAAALTDHLKTEGILK